MADSDTNLKDLAVADIMTSNIRTVSQNATLAEAAKVLIEAGVAGLPVVDEMGKCVGVLSSTDLVRRSCKPSSIGAINLGDCEAALVREGPNSPLHIERVPEDRVACHMSTAVQTIAPTSSVFEAAKVMSSASIHRVLVVDSRGSPLGVVSALDVLKALVT